MFSHDLLTVNYELIARDIFARDDSTDPTKQACAKPVSGEHGDNLSIGITAHSLLLYIALVCTGITVVSWLYLSWSHLHRYSSPNQQRQIIRCLFMPVFRCGLSVGAILDYQISILLDPIGGAYEAFCIAALFFLFLDYTCPDPEERPDYFGKMDNVNKKGKVIAGGGWVWYKYTFMMVLQYPITKTIVSGIEIITQAAGVYCSNSLSPKHAHIWLDLFGIMVIGGAVGACIRFQRRLKKEMDPIHKATAKLWSFKGMVIFGFLVNIFFGLFNGKTVKPSSTLTYDDIYYGLPNCIQCIYSAVFSLVFQWTFRSREYHHTQNQSQRVTTFKAIFDALNLSDVIKGSWDAFRMIFYNASTKYTGRGGAAATGPRRQKTGDLAADTMHLEPLSHGRDRAWSQGSYNSNDGAYEPQTEYGAPQGVPQYGAYNPSNPPQGSYMQTAYHPEPVHSTPSYAPPYIEVPREQMGGRGYAQLSHSRDPSPMRDPQNPRDMV